MLPDSKIFEVLKRHQVPFVIVGGHAVNFHGYARVTEDTDVVWLRSPEAEAALAKALAEIDACYIGKEIDPATRIERTHPVSIEYIRSHHLMMLCTGCGFFDLFTYVDEVLRWVAPPRRPTLLCFTFFHRCGFACVLDFVASGVPGSPGNHNLNCDTGFQPVPGTLDL